MELMEAVKTRHSVRAYTDRPIEADKTAALNREIDACNRESGLHIQLVTEEPEAFRGFMAHYGSFRNVRSYIALIGKKAPQLDEKIGYYGERIVLAAQQLGLNTCWVALTYRRKKTGQQLSIKWEQCMQEIIEKYPPNPTEYLLPIITSTDEDERLQYRNSLTLVNRKLKILSVFVRSPHPLSMYVARHSWASIAKSKNIPLSIISEGMGHDSETTTQIYLASLDTTIIDRANYLILNDL